MIEVKNVTKSYGNGLPAIKNLNMKINDGEFVFVVGASGSGKLVFQFQFLCMKQLALLF